jgi:hypothetical protein
MPLNYVLRAILSSPLPGECFLQNGLAEAEGHPVIPASRADLSIDPFTAHCLSCHRKSLPEYRSCANVCIVWQQ